MQSSRAAGETLAGTTIEAGTAASVRHSRRCVLAVGLKPANHRLHTLDDRSSDRPDRATPEL
jgi:hypothetical protein